MYPIGIRADDGATSLRDRLAGELAEHGPVAIVGRDGQAHEPPSGATTAFRVGDDGWAATGTDSTVDDLLESLAPDHEYTLITGFPELDIPFIAVGETTIDGDVLLEADDGASVTVDGVRTALESVDPFETLESLVAEVKRSPKADRAGAIATFTGRVRVRDHATDDPTTHLEFEKYAGVAEEGMTTISAELMDREGVYAVTMHHRTGVIDAGEDIVFVVVLAGHRDEAFQTVSDGIDRLKAEVPIFKKEVTVEESFWVHDRH